MCSKEKLGFGALCLNVTYNILLLLSIMLAAISVGTFNWIEATEEKMAQFADLSQTGGQLNKVSCGVMSYCVDSNDAFYECEFPWPLYNGSLTGQPDPLWSGTAACIALACVLFGIAYLYTLVACFGCYYTKFYERTAFLVRVGSALIFIALIIFGASFPAFAVKDCVQNATDGSCSLYKPVFPSNKLQPDGNIGCRICAPNMSYFALASSCSFGWGGGIAIAALVISLFASFIASYVESKQKKRDPNYAM